MKTKRGCEPMEYKEKGFEEINWEMNRRGSKKLRGEGSDRHDKMKGHASSHWKNILKS